MSEVGYIERRIAIRKLKSYVRRSLVSWRKNTTRLGNPSSAKKHEASVSAHKIVVRAEMLDIGLSEIVECERERAALESDDMHFHDWHDPMEDV
jgi:hypothetical protein